MKRCPQCGLTWDDASRAVCDCGYRFTSGDAAGGTPSDTGVQPDASGASWPVVSRYRDAYRVGSALVGLGNAIKIIGGILAAVILIGSLSSASGPFGGAGIILGGIFVAAVVGILFWVCGVIVAAQGQILRATLDNAVAHSPFLNDRERLDAMGLPRSVADRRPA